MQRSFFAHAANAASRLVAGEMVIVRVPDGEMTILNESGSALWAAADGTRTAEDLAATLQSRYGLGQAPDVRPFLQELVAGGLLTESEAPAPARVTPPAPSPTAYAPPATQVQEKLETLAGICVTSFGGFANCRFWPTCLRPWN